MQNIETTKLDNGLTSVKIHLPNFHTITNFLVIRSGSRYETPKNNGVAHFLEHMVFKGTKSYKDSREVAEAIEAIGGYFNAWTANDHTCYWNIVPASQWQRGIQVASELAFTPKLRDEDMQRERGVIIEEIRRMNDDPAHLVDDMLGEVLFPDNPLGYSIIGTEDSINAMTIEQFQDYHKEHYAPSQAYFVTIGNLTGKDIDGEIMRQSAHMKPQTISKPEFVDSPSTNGLKVLNKKTDQTHFMLGLNDPALSLQSPDRFVAYVLNAVLGRGMSSRLFLNIRERKGLAYAISSQFQPFEDTGAFLVYGGVNTDKVHLTLEALDEEFEKLTNELVGEKELSKAKEQVAGSFDLSADRPIDMAQWYGTGALLGAKETYEQAKELVRSVTDAQVQELAQRILSKERQALAVIGPYKDTQRFKDFLKLK